MQSPYKCFSRKSRGSSSKSYIFTYILYDYSSCSSFVCLFHNMSARKKLHMRILGKPTPYSSVDLMEGHLQRSLWLYLRRSFKMRSLLENIRLPRSRWLLTTIILEPLKKKRTRQWIDLYGDFGDPSVLPLMGEHGAFEDVCVLHLGYGPLRGPA